MSGVSPRTRLVPLGVLPGALLVLLSACGTPPTPPRDSPPLAGPSAAPLSLDPSAPGLQPTPPTAPTFGTYPTYPTYAAPTYTTTEPATTVSPTPTPSHASRCTGSPTGAQILAVVKTEGKEGIPKKTLKVDDGPFCSGTWSFTTVEVAGESTDEVEPLMVVATGKDATLHLVGAGSDVCTDQVQTDAPPGIRVLACGF